MFVLAAALKSGMSIDELYKLTRIDHWFLLKMRNIVECYSRLEDAAAAKVWLIQVM